MNIAKHTLVYFLIFSFLLISFLGNSIKPAKAAEDCSKIKLTPTNFHYAVYTQKSGKLEVMFRWTPPTDAAYQQYGTCKGYRGTVFGGNSNIQYNLAVYDLQGKNYYDQWLMPAAIGGYQLGMESKALSENDGLLPNKSYSARLDVIDKNISSAHTIEETLKDRPEAILGTARIGQIIFNSDSATTKGAGTTGECAPNDLTGNFEMYEDYDDHNLHLKWKANKLLANPKCRTGKMSGNDFAFKVTPINGYDGLYGGTTDTNHQYSHDSGKSNTVKEGTYKVCTHFLLPEDDPDYAKFKKLEGCASIDMKFFPAGTIGGDVPPEGPEKDASKLGGGTECENKCKTAWYEKFSISANIQAAICSMQCTIISWEAEIIAIVVKNVLYPALGLPIP